MIKKREQIPVTDFGSETGVNSGVIALRIVCRVRLETRLSQANTFRGAEVGIHLHVTLVFGPTRATSAAFSSRPLLSLWRTASGKLWQ